MGTILFLGFIIGMKHALEADHVAAVASLATRSRNLHETVRLSTLWGLGHAMTLLLFGSTVLLLDTVVPRHLAQALEFVAGGMLVVLGAQVLYRLASQRIHWHVHEHGDGGRHFHAHSHAGEVDPHDPRDHHHTHQNERLRLGLRALLVGTMHGMAGSAALILLVLNTVRSTAQGMAAIAMFGMGSIFGMALLSVVAAMPLRLSAAHLTWAHPRLQAVIGVLTVVLGVLSLAGIRPF